VDSILRILYVDDSRPGRAQVVASLGREPGEFEVVEAANREEFETLLRDRRWHLVLGAADVAGLSLRVLDTVRAVDPVLPVILIAGAGNDEMVTRALSLGAAEVVIRSDRHIERLPQTIRAALENCWLTEDRRRTLSELEAILEATADGILVVDGRRKVVCANRKFQQLWGIPDELMASGDDARVLEHAIEQLAEPDAFMALVERLYEDSGETSEDVVQLKDGRVFERYSKPHSLRGGVSGRVWSFRDITPVRLQTQTIRHLNRLYAALSQINHAIAMVKTRDGLFANICEALVEKGQFKLAWIGWLDSTNSTVSVASQYGDSNGYLSGIRVRSDDTPEGRGPVGRAIRSGQQCIADLVSEASTAPWHAAAARSGFQACGAFPIRMRGRVCGALAVYVGSKEFFGIEENQLLVETARNISFALDHLEGDSQRRETEAALARSENRFRVMFEQSSDALLILDIESGGFTDCNQAALRMFGVDDKQSMISLRPEQISPPLQPDGRDSAEKAREMVASAFSHGGHHFEWTHRRTDGSDFVADIQLTPITLDGQHLVIGNLRDITWRKRNDLARAARQQIAELAQSTMSLPELCGQVHAIIGELLPARNFFVAIYDDRRNEVSFPYFVDENDVAPGTLELDASGLSGHVIRTGKALLVTPDNVWNSPDPDEQIIGTNPVDWLGVPLESRSGTIGALVVQSYNGAVRYTDADQTLLEFVSSQVAAAIERKRSDAALRESEMRLEEAQRLGHLGSWSWDLSSDTLSWSDELCRIYGVDPATHYASFRDFLARVHADDRNEVEVLVAQAMQDKKPFHHETRILRPNGEVRTVFDKSEVVVDESGHVIGMFGACLDVTERKLAERMEADRRQILEQVAQNQQLPGILSSIVTMLEAQIAGSRISILLLRNDRLWLGASSQSLARYVQSLEGMLIGPTAASCGTAGYLGEAVIVDDIESDPLWEDRRDIALSHGLRACWSMPIPSRDGGVLGTLAVYRSEPGRPGAQDLEFMGTATQLSAVAIEHRLTTDRLSHHAQHDSLTGLPNRLLFQDRLEQALAYARRNARQVAVLYLDLDRFKNTNDTMGHSVGDALLREVARRFRGCIRSSDTLARIGGDEFTVVLTELASAQDAMRVAGNLLDSLRMPVLVDDHEIFVSASVGISIFPGDGADGETLMANADVAMYRAKDLGRNNVQWFTAEMNQKAKERMALERQLRHALVENQLSLHYQPQCSASGEIRCFEALMRWHNPVLGQVSPERFIPIAEENGLIVPMGEWALREACAQGAAWRNAGHPHLQVAVNVSAIQYKRADWVESVRRALRDTQLPPSALELEITEGLLLHDVAETSAKLMELRKLGVGIAIDDFGTGYSSLSYLHKLPVTSLKIDKSFVSEIGSDSPEDAVESPIIRTIIALAHNLGLSVVAEGVETAIQRKLLLAMGCNTLQGYFLHRPLAPEDAGALLGIVQEPTSPARRAPAKRKARKKPAAAATANSKASAPAVTDAGKAGRSKAKRRKPDRK
jgi:diguanylate cyclase (GGDEF)-like protein/PAS domain S-box-containing protein